MPEVRPTDSTPEALEKAVKLFKKQCIKSGLIQELKDRRYFIKKSDRKRAKRASAKRRIAIENKKNKLDNK